MSSRLGGTRLTVLQMVSADERNAVVARCRLVLGDPAEWVATPGYPDSLALCVIDAIWSIGIRYRNVERVVGRYRDSAVDADRHSLNDLLASIDRAGGTDAWRDKVGTRHRTSSRGGIYKADAVVQAAHALKGQGINTTTNLRVCDEQSLEAAELAWRSVRGQRSGISWHYLLLLTGAEDVKPDRMICRFLDRAVGYYPKPTTARALVMAAAAELATTPRVLDHRIWRYESGRN